jgi:hypothetical protein
MNNNNILENGQILSNQNKYSNDPKYQHLAETFRILGYIFVHHIDVWKNAAKQLEEVYTAYANINAGGIFKSFLSVETGDLLTTQTFTNIQNSFTTALSDTTLKRFTGNLNSFNLMFECCKYFFIPARLNADTIPDDIKEISLRNWLLIIMTIPFIRAYCDKYYTTMNNINFLYTVYDQLEQKEKINAFVETVKFTWIKNNVISELYTSSHPTQVFIRVFMHIALLASIEILKIYNPTVKEANMYNPDYDGAWLVPIDHMREEHLKKLQDLFKLVKTSKYTPDK